MLDGERKYLRPSDVVTMTGLSKTKIMEDVWSGKLEAYRVGRSWLIPVGAVEKWIGHRDASNTCVTHFGVDVDRDEDRVYRTVQKLADGQMDTWVRRTHIMKTLGNVKRGALSSLLHQLNAKGLLEMRTVETRTKPAEEWRIIDWSTGSSDMLSTASDIRARFANSDTSTGVFAGELGGVLFATLRHGNEAPHAE